MGVLLCLLSAAAFGSMAIFGKLAYDDGVGVLTLLAVRFAMASLLLVPLTAATGRLRAAGPRVARMGFALGAVGYATQAGLFFAALDRMDASLLSLLLYTYPAMVVAAALLLGRERRDGRRLAALGVASSGVALVLAGAGTGAFDAAGAAMALGAAAAYTTYILVADARVHGTDPLALTTWVVVGAATSFTVLATATGQLDVAFAAQGWLWLGLIALVCTVAAVLAFFGGLQRVGPSAASILSTFEPPVTVALAFATFGERLSGIQLLGGAFVLAAVVVLQVRPRGVPARADAVAPAAA